MELLGTYLAAPVAEVFPGCSTTNWRVVTASPLHPSLGWSQTLINARVPAMFTATNPTVYGMTTFFDYWKPEYRLERERVDQFYTHFLLRDVSNETANRQIFAPHLESIPWVARWCPDGPGGVGEQAKRPIMSRERYREVLRHLWFRGINGMQIFNHVVPGYEHMAVFEVEDAVAIYDEALQFRDFLEGGEVMNLTVPKLQDSGVVWSGLRLANRAVVRVFKQGMGASKLTVEPWPKKRAVLNATSTGETYLLELATDGKVSVAKAAAP
jgi:hypothetical protein